MTFSRPISRRQAMLRLMSGSAGTALGLAGLSRFANARAIPAGSLCDLAEARGVLFGASISASSLQGKDGASYGAVYANETRIVTTDLELKIPSLRPAPDVFNFEPADIIIAFANKHGLKVRGHTLIWNEWLPDWIKKLSKKDLAYFLDSHIETVASRYRGRLHSWDVVNEPLEPWNEKPGHYRQGAFYDQLGPDYVPRSFRRARAADPLAKLILNDAGTELDNNHGRQRREGFSQLVKSLLDADVPIDGIGFESHLDATETYNFEMHARYVEELSNLGLDVYITELDVDDRKLRGSPEARDKIVADLYYAYLKSLLGNKRVKVVQTWQLIDSHTGYYLQSVRDEPKATRRPRPVLFDDTFRPKPARAAVARALSEMPTR